jgi:nitric oxide dioxygenase
MIKREDSLYKSAGPWTSWRDFRISKKVPESEQITSFYISPVDGKSLPSYLPGQYISVATSVPSTMIKTGNTHSPPHHLLNVTGSV